MPYVYSTSTAGVDYTDYHSETKDLNQPIRKVSVKGGSGVSNKHFITPLGVATEVTDDELAFLEKHPTFQMHKKAGFVTTRSDLKDTEKVVAEDLQSRDESAPYTPQDFAADKKEISEDGTIIKSGKRK